MKKDWFVTGLKLSSVIALLAATGCAEYHKRMLHYTDECGTEFTKTLAKEYESLGNTEQQVMYDDYSAAYYFSKAALAKEGNIVVPWKLEDLDIPKDKLPELCAARERLMRALSMGAREVAPKMTAYTQAHFDCWAEQQAEGWQKDDIAACRYEFYMGMADVELMLMGGILKTLPASMVFFDFNSSRLDAESLKAVDQAAQIAKSNRYTQHILLVGRTDRIGDLKHNKNLSKHRAVNVKKELIRRGVPPHLITIKAVGETPGPKVDAHNRRVDIILLRY